MKLYKYPLTFTIAWSNCVMLCVTSDLLQYIYDLHMTNKGLITLNIWHRHRAAYADGRGTLQVKMKRMMTTTIIPDKTAIAIHCLRSGNTKHTSCLTSFTPYLNIHHYRCYCLAVDVIVTVIIIVIIMDNGLLCHKTL